MTINKLPELIKTKQFQFQDVLKFINDTYSYTASNFSNGTLNNAASENQGSARVLYAAYLAELSKEDTLILFAEHYEAVLENPYGTDHQNIRQFMIHGWDGVVFSQPVLVPKNHKSQ